METRFEYTLDLSGLDRLAAGFDEAIQAALETSGEEAASDMRARVPVRTGRLRDSIDHHVTGTGTAADPLTLTLEATEPYAGFVEFGARGAAGRPYFTPALEQMENALPERVRRNLGERVR